MLRLHHTPRLRPIQRARFGRLAKAGFFFLGMPAGSFCSIDVTARCNLRCRHCYFIGPCGDAPNIPTFDLVGMTLWGRTQLSHV